MDDWSLVCYLITSFCYVFLRQELVLSNFRFRFVFRHIEVEPCESADRQDSLFLLVFLRQNVFLLIY